tara:strand:+ start:46 stop:375 length:330 start_codon:yes stop_codon:yes gene_type:complete
MKLITKEVERKLARNATISPAGREPVVKFFDPSGAATWLISEIDDDGDTMFGLADLGMGYPELGYVSLAELKSVKGSFGLGIERDLYFSPDKTLDAYADAARVAGRINA